MSGAVVFSIAAVAIFAPLAQGRWSWTNTPPLTGTLYTQLPTGSTTGSGTVTMITSPYATPGSGAVGFNVSAFVNQPTGGTVTADGTNAGFQMHFLFTGTSGSYSVVSEWQTDVNVWAKIVSPYSGLASLHTTFGFNGSLFDGTTLIGSGAVRVADFWGFGSYLAISNLTVVTFSASLVNGHTYLLSVMAFANLYADLSKPYVGGPNGSIESLVSVPTGFPATPQCELTKVSVF